MSKNYFRTQLRKLGKGSKEKKNRGKSSSPTSPDSVVPPSVSPTQVRKAGNICGLLGAVYSKR